MDKTFTVTSQKTVQAESVIGLELIYEYLEPLEAGSKIWLFYDIRQDAGRVQNKDEKAGNFLSAGTGGQKLETVISDGVSRTLDLYPDVPEFHVLTEIIVPTEISPCNQTIKITINQWKVPLRPIKRFHFWLVVDQDAAWDFVPIGYKSYKVFVDRNSGERIDPEIIAQHLMETEIEVRGEYHNVPAISIRKTPGVFWGELHGMAFNQRPLDDFYIYAKNITHLDFCAAMLFSYNTCVDNVWQKVKEAVNRHTVPGKFIAFTGFECGTPPDDSHRCVYFPEPENVPPIFCDSRPPAQDAMLHKRFHPDAIICKTLDEFYKVIKQYRGFVGGHYHTLTYNQELLAEMWQKQKFKVNEEERIFEYMRQGKHFGLVGGSDTHDSMPGNPYPEPGCPRPAGFTGVWADELTAEALIEAFQARRVYATSGARIVLRFDSSGHSMGSELALRTSRVFHIYVEGTDNLASVELLRDGYPVKAWHPEGSIFETEFEGQESNHSHPEFYLVRVKQTNGHLGWTSPIWFG